MSIKRVFLGTSSPLPQLAAEKLLSGKGKLPDFGNMIFSVPGNYARTAFQDALATTASNGVFEPQIMTPGVLLHYGIPESNIPDQIENELIWNKTAVKAAKSGNFDKLFPGYHEEMNISGAHFSHLRLELAAGGFSINDAKEHLGSRGEQLAELEKLYLQELAELGFDDRLATDISAAEQIECFSGFDKIILCGMVDLPILLKKRIENISKAFPDKVEAWIYADSDKADFFDHAGCAIPEKWNDCAIEIDDFNNTVHCVETFNDAAEKLTELFETNGKVVFDDTAIVLADPAMFPVFQRTLAKWAAKHGGKLDLYDPSGIPVSELRLHKLMSNLLAFCKNMDDFDTAVQLIKNPDFLLHLAKCAHKRTSTLLKALDRFILNVLPSEVSNATAYLEDNKDAHPLINQIFNTLEELLAKYKHTHLAPFLREFFTDVFRERKNAGIASMHNVSFYDECTFFQDALDKLEKINITSDTSSDELFELFCKQTGQERLSSLPTENALAIQGCLELPFLHEKNIFFCGFSSSSYPDRIDPAVYLTDTIRRKIGIRSNNETFARAAAHLYPVCKTAKKNSKIHFISTKRNATGEPLFPSPLFFCGKHSQEELLKRCKKFFMDSSLPAADPDKWKSEYSYFHLAPQLNYSSHKDNPDIPVLSVTFFSEYIKNPLDCFFSRVMKMQKTDYISREPDQMTLGNIVHETFQKLGTDIFTSEEEYCLELKKHLDEVIYVRYGNKPSSLLEVVKENISQRMEYAAPKMRESAKRGFIPLENEFVLGGEEKMLPCYISDQGVPDVYIKGTIDRIEYLPSENLIRIVDFKTGNSKKINDLVKSYSSDDKSKIELTDLQMPLYADLLRQDENFRKRHPEIDMENVKIECAYFTLPQTVTETEILVVEHNNIVDIIDMAWQKVYEIINEMKSWKKMEMSEKGCKSQNFKDVLLPDVQSCLPDIFWY